MARIRTIKPEFWTNDKILSISPLARLMFIGMWNFADDYGRMDFAPISIKARIFPTDATTVADVRNMLNELCSNDLITIYSAKGKEYIEITGWDHQKIDKRQASKIPAPFDDGCSIRGIPPTPADHSPTPADHSPTPAPVMEGNGKEGKGEKGNSVANATGAIAPPDPSIPEREFFKRGKEVLGKSAGGQLSNLLKVCGGNVSLARSKLELAATKENPREFIAGVIRAGPQTTARPMTVHQAKHAEGREILNELREFNARAGSREDSGLLRQHSGDGPESLRGGAGGNLIELSPTRDRSRG